ncbi:MAG TPA: hypothetical protein VNO81_08635 [Candidatus Nitrosotenuis sp.]|jgi:hypothetical protein|nr:hypothetical protein [Candidatus Nitrosotenuis sp.]
MDGFYVWQEMVGEERFLLKAYLKEEPLQWRARVVDNAGAERWSETFGSREKARAALLARVPDDARFVKGAVPE